MVTAGTLVVILIAAVIVAWSNVLVLREVVARTTTVSNAFLFDGGVRPLADPACARDETSLAFCHAIKIFNDA